MKNDIENPKFPLDEKTEEERILMGKDVFSKEVSRREYEQTGKMEKDIMERIRTPRGKLESDGEERIFAEESKFFEKLDERTEEMKGEFVKERGVLEGERGIRMAREKVGLNDDRKLRVIQNFISRGEMGEAKEEIGYIENKFYNLIKSGSSIEAEAARLLLRIEFFKIYDGFPPEKRIEMELEALSNSLFSQKDWEDKTKRIADAETILELLKIVDEMKKSPLREDPYSEWFEINIIKDRAEGVLSEKKTLK